MTKNEKDLIIKEFRKILKKDSSKKLAFFVEYSKDWNVSKKTVSRWVKEAKKGHKKDKKKDIKIFKKGQKRRLKVSVLPENENEIEIEENSRAELKAKRVLEFVTLLEFGHIKNYQFLDYAKEQEWDVAERTIYRYLKEARETFYKAFELENKKNIKEFTTNVMTTVINRAIISGNDKLALDAAKALNDAYKLQEFKSFKKEISKKSKHISGIEELEMMFEDDEI